MQTVVSPERALMLVRAGGRLLRAASRGCLCLPAVS
jgi:hypothetical protein